MFFQVKNALKLSRTKKQWVDLVDLWTCGPEGAAVALWVKLHYCLGIISSFESKTGFAIYCFDDRRI